MPRPWGSGLPLIHTVRWAPRLSICTSAAPRFTTHRPAEERPLSLLRIFSNSCGDRVSEGLAAPHSFRDSGRDPVGSGAGKSNLHPGEAPLLQTDLRGCRELRVLQPGPAFLAAPVAPGSALQWSWPEACRCSGLTGVSRGSFHTCARPGSPHLREISSQNNRIFGQSGRKAPQAATADGAGPHWCPPWRAEGSRRPRVKGGREERRVRRELRGPTGMRPYAEGVLNPPRPRFTKQCALETAGGRRTVTRQGRTPAPGRVGDQHLLHALLQGKQTAATRAATEPPAPAEKPPHPTRLHLSDADAVGGGPGRTVHSWKPRKAPKRVGSAPLIPAPWGCTVTCQIWLITEEKRKKSRLPRRPFQIHFTVL